MGRMQPFEAGRMRPAEARLRVALAEDHCRVLEELQQLLSGEFDVVAAVNGGVELVEAAERTRPDVVVSDIAMPDLDGIEAARRILCRGASAAVVLLTSHDNEELLRRATRAGILGFVLKVDAGDELLDAVRAASRGSSYISRSVGNVDS